MTGADPHTVKAFDEDLERIRAMVAEMGGLAEAAVASAAEALMHGDPAGASKVVADDARIDRLSGQIERHCVQLIALRAPMADDLRQILAAFKIAAIVERMGDCARSIAEQVPMVQSFRHRSPMRILKGMSAAAGDMTQSALDAFVKQDPAAAEQVGKGADTLDALHDDLFLELVEVMAENPATITPCTCLLLASHKLDRIGAHASNIARITYYGATGSQLAPPQSSRSTAAAT